MRSQPPRVLLATSSIHKLREIAEMLGGNDFRLVGLQEFPEVTLPPEDGATFEENAAGKAVAAARQTGLLAIGDDSGLEVNALGGAPGIFSARFAGPGATDADNLELLLSRLRGVPDEDRAGRFVCAIAVAAPDGRVQTLRRTCEGVITPTPIGENGFGYDPVFRIPGDGRTLAQFAPHEKNAISHRGKAVREAQPLILRMLNEAQESS